MQYRILAVAVFLLTRATSGAAQQLAGGAVPAADVDVDTLFQIASNTKAFTTASLAILVDEGKLKWDDPVTK